MLSACLSDEGISLGQLNVDKKTNETQLIDMLDIKGCIVTADAMGCQKEVVRKIVKEKKASYVIAVKDKQKSLREQILEIVKMVRPSSVFTEVDAGHGRVEERVYRIYRDLSFVTGVWNGEKLSALVVVESLRYNKKKQTGGTKLLARMRKQAAWNTRVLEEILFRAFGGKKRDGGKLIRNSNIEMRLP